MRIIVTVIRGGPHEYEASIQNGAALLRALDADRYEPRDIVVSQDNFWYRSGVAVSPERALRGSDAVINCVGGRYGEDGWLAHLIQKLGHRFAGSRGAPSALAFNRRKSRTIARDAGLLTPKYRVIMRGVDPHVAALELFRTFSMPAVVKPVEGALSPSGIAVGDLPELERLLTLALGLGRRAMVEEYVPGASVSVGIVEGWRGERERVFLSGDAPASSRDELAYAALLMHQNLGLRHFSESRFITGPRGTWYIKTNALPEFAEGSSFSDALLAAGVGMPEFAEHVVALAGSSGAA